MIDTPPLDTPFDFTTNLRFCIIQKAERKLKNSYTTWDDRNCWESGKRLQGFPKVEGNDKRTFASCARLCRDDNDGVECDVIEFGPTWGCFKCTDGVTERDLTYQGPNKFNMKTYKFEKGFGSILFSPFDDSVGTALLTPSKSSAAPGEYNPYNAIDTTLGDALAGTAEAAGAISAVVGGLDDLAAIGGVISGVGPVLSIASMAIGLVGYNTDTSTGPGFKFMNQKFDEIHNELDKLSYQIDEGFKEVLSQQAAKSEVSGKIHTLKNINRALRDFASTQDLPTRSTLYADNFRYACNGDTNNRPESIFW